MDNKYRYCEQNLEINDALMTICRNLHYNRREHVEQVALRDSLARITAEDIYAPLNQPPFDRSPYDGYALKSNDIQKAGKKRPVCLQVVGRVDAGEACNAIVHDQEAVRIMTGAPIPSGADCVIPQEYSDYGEDAVMVYQPVEARQNICWAGEDFKKDDCLIQQDTYITAVEMALIASMGYPVVKVYQSPRVGIFTTGDELVAPGEALPFGKIYNSNLYLLWGRLKELGIEPVYVQVLPDDEDRAKEVLSNCSQNLDLILTTGGVSVGKKDIMHGVLTKMQADKIFWKIRVKPGGPIIFATYHHVPIIALSGNPFGVAAHLELIVRRVLFEMTGNQRYNLKYKKAVMQDHFAKKSNVVRYLRGFYHDGRVSQTSGLHSSGALAAMQGSNCLIEVSAGRNGIAAGELVDVLLWNE